MAGSIDLSGRLMRGERILWSGIPRQGILFTPQDSIKVPFSLAWGGFAIYWEIGVSTTNAPFFFRLFGIPFVLAGLFLMFGRFLLDARVRQSVVYAVTTERILIDRRGLFSSFTALPLVRLPDATLTESRDGRGTIRFGPSVPMWGSRSGWSGWMPSLDPTPQFLGIENAASVFDLIQRTVRGPA